MNERSHKEYVVGPGLWEAAGGPAFPAQDSDTFFYGMSIRDWFAGRALQGLLVRARWDEDQELPKLAGWSYQIADAMLEARKK